VGGTPKVKMNHVSVNKDRTEVTVSGEADGTVRVVAVTIGPKLGTTEQYWRAGTLDPAPTWTVTVKTAPRLPPPNGYGIRIWFDSRTTIRIPTVERTIEDALDCGENGCLGSSPIVIPGSW
jgi:hypothetical protein